jgi:hypothetical protein
MKQSIYPSHKCNKKILLVIQKVRTDAGGMGAGLDTAPGARLGAECQPQHIG